MNVRYFRTLLYSESHRVSISMKLRVLGITLRCHFNHLALIEIVQCFFSKMIFYIFQIGDICSEPAVDIVDILDLSIAIYRYVTHIKRLRLPSV